MAGQLAGVHSFNAGGVVALEPVIHGGICAPAGVQVGKLADDDSCGLRCRAFAVFLYDTVVADEGIGHSQNLPLVSGVSHDFLVAHHGGVEAGFACYCASGTNGDAFENCPVF